MALNFPNSGLYEGYQYTGDNGVTYTYDGVKWVGRVAGGAAGTNSLNNGTFTVQVDGDGNLVLPTGAVIKDEAGDPYSASTDRLTSSIHQVLLSSDGSISFPGNAINAGNSNIAIKSNNNLWTFDTDGILTVPSGGAIQQRFTWTRAVQPNLSTPSAVIWTSLYNYISSVKLTIQLEANETGDATGWHSQVCEAVVASRGYANSAGGPLGEPVMTVYGVTYTSTAPLVTFSVQRNPTTNNIEIVGTQTAACDGSANFRIHSVEMATRD